MSSPRKTVVTVVSCAALVATLAACQKEGPAERAGKEIDNTVKKLTQHIELPVRVSDELVSGPER